MDTEGYLDDTRASESVRTHLRLAYRQSGLSQRDLAERMGLSHASLGRLLKGERKVTVDDVDAMAEALGLPWQWFYEDWTATGTAPEVRTSDRLAELVEELRRNERKRGAGKDGSTEEEG